MTGQTPTPETLRALLRYDGNTGKLYWRERSVDAFTATERKSAEAQAKWWNSRNAGKEAITALCDGYRCGIVLRKSLKAHRIIWAMAYNEWPDELDHINGDRCDNRLSNLRPVTRQENCRNRAKSSRNSSGVVGVLWAPRHRKWAAHICPGNSRTKTIGYFNTIPEAAEARRLAEIELGFHPNHGRDR